MENISILEDGVFLNLTESQRQLLNEYVDIHCKLMSYKSLLVVNEKILDEDIIKLGQYRYYTSQLDKVAADKLKNAGLSGIKYDAKKLESDVFKDIMLYSIEKREYDRLEEAKNRLDERMEEEFKTITATEFANEYVKELVVRFKAKAEFDDKFAEKVNDKFNHEERIPERMLIDNASLEDITLAAIKYLLNITKG